MIHLPEEGTKYFLFYAAAIGNESTVERFWDAGEVTQIESSSGLELAARRGHTKIVKSILNKTAELFPEWDIKEEDCIPVIEAAAESSQERVLFTVIEHAEDNSTFFAGRVALLAAARAGHSSLCQTLVDRGAFEDHGTGSVELCYILDAAIQTQNYTLADQVLDEDSIETLEILNLDSGNYTALDLAAQWGPFDGFKQMLSRGRALDRNDINCHQALVSATRYGQTDIVPFFLYNGFDVNGTYRAPDGSGNLLFRAVAGFLNDDLRIDTSSTVELLLNRNADIDALAIENRTSLAEIARCNGVTEIAQILLHRGANPLAGLHQGESAFQWAIQNRNVEMVEMFLHRICS